ncbi:hypothetical protein [Vallitalea maricola]|uniref:Uncharacterized protein n=1 Tax=Vallitalea maricola TaxID=3074433 RepID=A0ACB5UGM4_9FIRM|nr:hypothetical protein AN2V17_08400 [Vallitalea sp. AN17-2]
MTDNLFIEEIKKKDLDIAALAEKIIDNKEYRDRIVLYLTTYKEIMVYYNSYYVLAHASEIKPELFYEYWNQFASLLNHNNSYHRDIGMTLIANVTAVDVDNKFDHIFDEYVKCIDDEKFMTAQCCVRNLKKILKYREELIEKISNMVLNIEHITSYPKKQTELLKYDILEIFDSVYDKVEVDDKSKIDIFINECIESISPKTKKMAKRLKKKYKL